MIFINIYLFKVEFVGSEEAQIKIKTAGQRFMKPVNGNLTLPCRALYLGMQYAILLNHFS